MALALSDLPHYTYDDYIQWEGQWELIDGIAYAMVPAPSVEHKILPENSIMHYKSATNVARNFL